MMFLLWIRFITNIYIILYIKEIGVIIIFLWKQIHQNKSFK